MEIELGTSKADITPTSPLQLAGFAARSGNSRGVAHPLYARVVALRENSGDGSSRQALIISADLLWWAPEMVPRLRAEMKRRWGLAPENVLLCATHTHSGPQTSGRFAPSIGEPDYRYVEMLESRVLEAVDEAFNNLELVTIERGASSCDIGINRRKVVDGKLVGGPYEEGPADPQVSVVRFRRRTGTTKAVLVHYTCHPVTTMDYLVSPDFTGVAMEKLESSLGDESVALYLQGTCGDINPRVVRGGDNEVCELGSKLAAVVQTCLEQPMEQLQPVPLTGRQSTVSLPFQRVLSIDELSAQVNEPGIAGEWSRLLISDPSRIRPADTVELAYLKLADGLAILAMSGEITVPYGLEIKRRYGGEVLPMGYTNGMVGYIPTAQQIGEGGYEADSSTQYFGLPSRFSPEIERRMWEGIDKLMQMG